MKALRIISVFVVIAAWSIVQAAAQQTVFVDTGSVWKYLGDGTDQGTAWREVGFDDSTWLSGASPLGFGEADAVTDIGRTPQRATSYFRTEFEVSEALLANLVRFVMDIRRDDGVVVYLNGIEVRRDNMPEGEITSDTLALRALGGTEESDYVSTAGSSGRLVAGTNTLAVEVHNSQLGSSVHTDLHTHLIVC